MNVETLEDLFEYRLQHAYYAERSHAELLSEMATDSTNDDLGDRFADHRDRTERQVERLESVFAALGRQPRASRMRTVDGLAESRRERGASGVPGDLEIAMLATRLEIRTYEALLTLAGRLAYEPDVVDPLETTLAEEREGLRELEELETETPILETLEAEGT